MDSTVMCESCGQPMQLADEVKAGDGRVTARRFICNCNGVLKHKSVHEGDKTK